MTVPPAVDTQLLLEKMLVIHRAGSRLQQLALPQELAQAIIAVLEEIVLYEHGAVLLVDAPSGLLLPFALSEQGQGRSFVESDKAYVRSQGVRIGRGITGWVAEHGVSVRAGDVRADPRYISLRDDIRSELCVPLRVRERTIGVLNVETTQPDAYSAIDQIVLETIAAQIAIAIQNADMYRQVTNYSRELQQQNAELVRTEQRLRQNEIKFRALTEHVSDAIAIVADDGQIVFENSAIHDVLGYTWDTTTVDALTALVHPDDRMYGVASLIEALQAPGAMQKASLRMQDQQGCWRWIDLVGYNLRHVAAVQGIMLNLRDSTARRRLEEQLLQSQKLEAIGRLAGGIAHDFNNILGVIIGYSDVMVQERAALRADHREYIDQILQAGLRAADITRQLLSFSRQQVPQPKLNDINEALRMMATMQARLLGEAYHIEYRLAEHLPPIRIDQIQLQQIVLNLVLNARDAMPDGGRIVVETAPEYRYDGRNTSLESVVLSVADQGHGIDAATRSRIFEPFFTTKAEGQGTGLGLSIVYGIVSASHGTIDVESAPSRGTRFVIRLPAAVHQEEPAMVAPRLNSARPSAVVLLVEDDPWLATLLRRVLGRQGYHVVVCSDAREARELAAAQLQQIDLLLTDVTIPGDMNGMQLAEYVQQHDPTVRVLYMSGYIDNMPEQRESLVADARLLQKPFSADELLQAVATALA